jgi:hypothetical protein
MLYFKVMRVFLLKKTVTFSIKALFFFFIALSIHFLTLFHQMSNHDIERIKNLLGTHQDFPQKVLTSRATIAISY